MKTIRINLNNNNNLDWGIFGGPRRNSLTGTFVGGDFEMNGIYELFRKRFLIRKCDNPFEYPPTQQDNGAPMEFITGDMIARKMIVRGKLLCPSFCQGSFARNRIMVRIISWLFGLRGQKERNDKLSDRKRNWRWIGRNVFEDWKGWGVWSSLIICFKFHSKFSLIIVVQVNDNPIKDVPWRTQLSI